ncbi:DNA polymerase III subunit gamma/tau [Candidatus Enterovibrio escicola]|uniref:DNA polymerase III subunit gamma/tau n=1 Tax=Candidatus Enterovibrio escicola TaxID=1927127 RepID=UPI0012383408|nr:DNA polymerase III subunit gamma/tau [Candidatus Enterovibrio escacola]
MSYQALARKWRPHKFRDVVGQAHVVTALANALNQNRLHHAYLFSGTRGVGKTSIARIFAKSLNCEQNVTSTPCSECSSCQEFDQGRFVDLIEIDAASRTKVEDTRDLLNNVPYKPSRGRYKIYLIDEVHMLSRHSFNAFLKTLEEPPTYVKFLLATTDPQKLPLTVLSRCLQFHLKHLDTSQIKQQLEHILLEEDVSAESQALLLIAQAAEGSMRDALSLIDQAIVLGNGAILENQVTEMLGILSTDQALLLLEAIEKGDANLVMRCLTQVADVGVEWDGLLKGIASQLHSVAMAQAVPKSINPSSPDAERISRLARLMSPQDVQLFYQIVLQGRQDLPYAPDGHAGLEMVLLRMLAFRPVSSTRFKPKAIFVPSTKSTQQVPQTAHPSIPVVAQSELSALKVQVISNHISKVVPTECNVSVNPSPIAVSAPSSSLSMTGLRYQHAECNPKLSSLVDTIEKDTQQDHGQVVLHSVLSTEHTTSIPQYSVPQVSVVGFSKQSTSSNLLAVRNMLKNRGFQQERLPLKKYSPVSTCSKPSSPLSVIERVAAKNKFTDPAAFQTGSTLNADLSAINNDYYWQTTKVRERVLSSIIVTLEKTKKKLYHERTPEMREKLERESIKRDEWCKITNALEVPRRVKQMALHSAMERNGKQMTLILRPEQAHLNNDKMQALLTDALNRQLGASFTLYIELGGRGLTPLEWRDKLYTEKLTEASQHLIDDPHVSFICQFFSAILDAESIRPI